MNALNAARRVALVLTANGTACSINPEHLYHSEATIVEWAVTDATNTVLSAGCAVDQVLLRYSDLIFISSKAGAEVTERVSWYSVSKDDPSYVKSRPLDRYFCEDSDGVRTNRTPEGGLHKSMGCILGTAEGSSATIGPVAPAPIPQFSRELKLRVVSDGVVTLRIDRECKGQLADIYDWNELTIQPEK